MSKVSYTIAGFALFLQSSLSYGFASKPKQISAIKGVTESQVAAAQDHVDVMLRGKGAELLFKAMEKKQEEQVDTAALKYVGDGNGSEWVVHGKQITCSKFTKGKSTDFACGFLLDGKGRLEAARDAFDVATFNLARTETGSKIFKKKKDRSIASVAPSTALNRGQAYLVYDKPGQQRQSKQALIVLRGESAKDVLDLLESHQDASRASKWGGATGRKGEDIACVGPTDSEPARCAVVVSFRDGSATHSGNPLFR